MIANFDVDGGARLLVDSTAAAEVAAVGFWFDIGSRDESPLEAGSTHFVEHMLFKGTSTRNAFRIAREIDRLGGSINAFTERECVALYAVVPSDGFESALSILADLVSDSLFDAAEFERERLVIENEIEAADDDPDEASSDAFAVRLWGSHPLARKISGEINDVRSLTREGVWNRYTDHFRGIPRLMTFAGGLETERVLNAFVRAFPHPYKHSPRSAPPRTTPPRPEPFGNAFRTAPYQHVQTFCAFQLDEPIPASEFYALEVANAAIGESMGSRLFQELRERRGLCYSVFSAPTLLSETTLWTAYATASKATSGDLVGALSEELIRVARDGFEDEEIADAVAHVRGSMKIAAADAEYRMRRLARQALYGAPQISCEEADARVAAVDADAASAAMGRVFKCAPTIFGVGMSGARKSFSRAVERASDRFAAIGMKVES